MSKGREKKNKKSAQLWSNNAEAAEGNNDCPDIDWGDGEARSAADDCLKIKTERAGCVKKKKKKPTKTQPGVQYDNNDFEKSTFVPSAFCYWWIITRDEDTIKNKVHKKLQQTKPIIGWEFIYYIMT